MLTTVAAALALLSSGPLPKPSSLFLSGGYLTLPADTVLSAPHAAEFEAVQARKSLGGDLLLVSGANSASIRFKLDPHLADQVGPEGYQLNVDQVGVRLSAPTTTGLFYGVQTLRQISERTDQGLTIAKVEILDSPRFRWRGVMLDCARHFWSKEFIERLLDDMAAFKLNTFHWHLCDDQGWRLEIEKYPKLTKVGGWRSGTKGRSEVSDNVPYGGYYTRQDVREIVAYAAERHIEVIPEIEMPGHATAALAAYPEYSCRGLPLQVGQKWGVYPDVYCAGQDKTFEFLKDILEEVMDMFPSPYIHIGGDEVKKDRWKECPRCRARMMAEGLKDTKALQGYFVRRIAAFLANRGKKLVGWEEILDGGLNGGETVMAWRGRQGGIDAARAGHDVVMAPSDYCYLDHYQADPRFEPVAVGGFTPLKQVYAFEPIPSVLNPDEAKHIVGVQGNLWTEFVDTDAHAEYMLFPRLLALSEVGWTKPLGRDFSDFLRRLPNGLRILDEEGVRYRPLDDATVAQTPEYSVRTKR